MTGRDSDAFVVVHGFMMHDLGLSGIALLVFARIYGFCSSGESDFYESKQNTARFLNTSDRTVFRSLKELTESGLVIEAGVYEPRKGCATKRYRINWDKLDQMHGEGQKKGDRPASDGMSPSDRMSPPDKTSAHDRSASDQAKCPDEMSDEAMTGCQVIRKVDNKGFR